jgi:hypothetical protein
VREVQKCNIARPLSHRHIFWAYRQTYNWRSIWQRRPFPFQHFSLYLALNFGYMKGLRKMEQRVQK